MRSRLFELSAFGIDNLVLREGEPSAPAAGQLRLAVRAMSLNYRDLLVVRGEYNPRLRLPVVPISDAAGVVDAVGDGVTEVAVGDRVMTHYVADWIDGPFRLEYRRSTLGTPGPGVAAEHVVLPAAAVLPMPAGLDFAAAATLPIAALTAWSALITDGNTQPSDTVLTLGCGGVSLFAVQLGTALGRRVIVTSSSDDRIARARALGASAGINYVAQPAWDKRVLELTDGRGADLVIENGGIATLATSLRAVRAGGSVALLGSLTGLKGEVDLAAIFMKRVRVLGIFVNHRAAFAAMVRCIVEQRIRPVIDAHFPFAELPRALQYLATGAHFGKVVIDVA